MDDESSEDSSFLPHTPIHVLQSVGINLGIDPTKLTVEKLTATPGLKQKPKVTDD
jgi:hypothetical protein